MFGFLKKKFSSVIESLTKKKEEEEKLEEKIENVEKKIEEEPKSAIEEIKEIVEEKPEIKEAVEKELKKVEEKRTEKIVASPKEEKISLFKKIFKKISEKKLSEEDIAPILSELENGLIEGDVAYEVAEKIKNDLTKSLLESEVKRGEVKKFIVNKLSESLLGILNVPTIDMREGAGNKKPYVILFIGFNGAGKTTTLAKIGKWLLNQNYSCVFAAADTFRAASLEQLEEHAKRINVDVIKHTYGADPAAVIYDAIEHAKSKSINFVLADTAGRAHTNKDLLDEMKKIIRVNKPDLKILVVDSMTGNDAVLQARVFNEIGIDAVIFTKVDVNEKGGAILSVTHELKKPILFLSNGQEYENLISFNAKEFVDNLIGV
ncbi:MAG: signal recognition particle-docking protein FtsY [Candidatus Aenigmarchaeota archaeon]|nr:signal recognition particle-docking protein FtsY [Candidatus Aenigmarchaeota archaeon]